MSEKVFPRSKISCQHSKCKKDMTQIKHEERALVGFKRNGEYVNQAVIHESCYNQHGASSLRNKFPDITKTELAEVRYEITPDRKGFDCERDIMGEIQDKAEDLVKDVDDGDIYWLDQDIKNFTERILNDYGIYVHPKVMNDMALGLSNNGRDQMLIGEVVGDTSTDSFTFECMETIKKFDFVVVVTDDLEETDTVLAQVDEVTKKRDGSVVAEADIVGYKDSNGLLKSLRSTISPSSNVYMATQEKVSDLLDLNQEGLNIGVMENNDDLDVFLNADDLLQHIAVIAQTGFGKSYTVGNVIEELLSKDLPVVAIDPHGEYGSMENPNPNLDEDDVEKYEIEPECFSVKTYTEDSRLNDGVEIKFDSRDLSFEDFKRYCFSDLSPAQSREIKNVIERLQMEDDEYDLHDIRKEFELMPEDAIPNKTEAVIMDYIGSMIDSGLYSSDTDEIVKPEDLVQGGQLSIVNLKGTDPKIQKHIVELLSSSLFEQKKYGDLPPFVQIIEEAHNFIPGGKGSSECAETLSQIASEGRKFGMGLGVISQRPAKIDSDVLSQCKMQIILRVTNPEDLKSISKSFENVTSQVQNHITGLAEGNAIVLGNEYPLMTDVRTRKSKHGGTGHSFQENQRG